MTDNHPTHWTQFGSLYDLPDPRPYYRGVATSDYRMPGVAADLLVQLAPLLAARDSRVSVGSGPLSVIDFACGYGAIGTCLRRQMTMETLTAFYASDGDPEGDGAGLPPIGEARTSLYSIAGIDIAGVALDYGAATGACDRTFKADVLSEPIEGALAECIRGADLIIESGALGHLVAPAMANFLALGGRPWLIVCPRPRIDAGAIGDAVAAHGYRLHTVSEKLRYRRPFSDGELADEVEEAAEHGLPEEKVLVDGYFRVDLRLAIPEEESIGPVLDVLSNWNHNAI